MGDLTWVEVLLAVLAISAVLLVTAGGDDEGW